jgi:hypothetical protein
MNPNSLRRAPKRSTTAIERKRARGETLPADELAAVMAQFQSLDPGIVSDAIPAFFIGRNKEGFWVARDADGKIGGIFLLQASAVSFAKRNSQPAGCATIFPSERIELDIENKGNPFIVHLASLMQIAMRHRQQIAAFIGKTTEAIRTLLKGSNGS